MKDENKTHIQYREANKMSSASSVYRISKTRNESRREGRQGGTQSVKRRPFTGTSWHEKYVLLESAEGAKYAHDNY